MHASLRVEGLATADDQPLACKLGNTRKGEVVQFEWLKAFTTNLICTVIDNPVCNNDPNAILVLTPNWGNSTNYSFAPSAVVQYDDGSTGYATNRWYIYPPAWGDWVRVGHRWNVLVIKP